MTTLRVGTRGSLLARTQTGTVIESLRQAHSSLAISERVISTRGDAELSRPLPEIGGKGLFTEEIERALLDGEIDAAVHSLKDLPTILPDALCVTAIPARACPFDAIVSRNGEPFESLPRGARIGTSSLRRAAQLRIARPDIQTASLRGNLDTRLRKLREEGWDAIVVAAAGLERLNRLDEATEILTTDVMLPAVAQGALGIERRADDHETRRLFAVIHDDATARAVFAERTFLAALGGGCHVPIAAYAEVTSRGVTLTGFVADERGSRFLRASLAGNDAETVGKRLARDLLERGAAEMLSISSGGAST